jgi:HD-like signal output (HDOD) protein
MANAIRVEQVVAEVPTRERMRALFARISEQCDLPPLPAAAARAIALVRDPDTKADDLVRVVGSDAALAARVLRVSRSATYMRWQPPRTLLDAINTVGFDALRRVLIAASARSAYRADDTVAHELWEHALTTAIAADELTLVAGGRRGGAPFIAGLMHDIGRLVFHLSDPAVFASLPHDDEAKEADLYGVGHASVGACLAEQWGLEDEIVTAIMFHHRPDPAAFSELAGRLAKADAIAKQLASGDGDAAAETDVGATDEAAVADRVADTLVAERSLFD